ncbi:hypothetical protein, partial [Streptomyces cacaoi]|uniref:hypothetical protein n=1 Tax=Streptomyces cacaoi TaxID=1898 RepID=UPI0037482B10
IFPAAPIRTSGGSLFSLLCASRKRNFSLTLRFLLAGEGRGERQFDMRLAGSRRSGRVMPVLY